MLNGRVLIPGGTEGFAEVIQASDAKLGGRAGELTIGAPYLTIGDQRIRLKRLRYGPSTGRGAETEAMVAAALVGIPGMFITGRNVEVKSGTRANAVLVADTVVSVR